MLTQIKAQQLDENMSLYFFVFLASWLVSAGTTHRDEPVSIFISKAAKNPPTLINVI